MKTKRTKIAKLMLGLTTIAIAATVLCLAPSARAQETDTITITGTFTSDTGEHTWSVAMYGTTYLHYGYIDSSHNGSLSTDVRATSFDLRFSGPDADDFNRVASEQLAGGDVSLQLRNVYQGWESWSTMALWISSPDGSVALSGNVNSSNATPPDTSWATASVNRNAINAPLP